MTFIVYNVCKAFWQFLKQKINTDEYIMGEYNDPETLLDQKVTCSPNRCLRSYLTALAACCCFISLKLFSSTLSMTQFMNNTNSSKLFSSKLHNTIYFEILRFTDATYSKQTIHVTFKGCPKHMPRVINLCD